LNPTTIQDLMVFMCATRFEIEDDELAFTKDIAAEDGMDILPKGEAERDQIDLISDYEEDGPVVEIRSQVLKRIGVSSESDSDSDIELPQRVSRRARKRPRGLDGFEVDFR
jgi:hypothetical protein